MTTKKQKRSKKKHYKTGIHNSPKCTNGPIKYRSGWEKVVCEHLDHDPNVESYEYEAISIKYVSNKRTQRERIYIPDFLIVYCDKTKKLVEVKRRSQLNNRAVLKKAEAAKEWGKRKNIKYEIWSEKQIRAFQKMQKSLEENQ